MDSKAIATAIIVGLMHSPVAADLMPPPFDLPKKGEHIYVLDLGFKSNGRVVYKIGYTSRGMKSLLSDYTRHSPYKVKTIRAYESRYAYHIEQYLQDYRFKKDHYYNQGGGKEFFVLDLEEWDRVMTSYCSPFSGKQPICKRIR